MPDRLEGPRDRLSPGTYTRASSRDALTPTLVLIACSIVLAFGYPLVNENAGGPCAALEYRVASAALSAQGGGTQGNLLATAMLRSMVGASEGAMAASAVKARYPALPPFLGCTVLYWKALADPGSVGRLPGMQG